MYAEFIIMLKLEQIHVIFKQDFKTKHSCLCRKEVVLCVPLQTGGDYKAFLLVPLALNI